MNDHKAMSQSVALVTGSSRGIGATIAKMLGKEKYFVYLNVRQINDQVSDTLRIIRENGGDGEILTFDLSDPQSIAESFQKFKHTQLDLLINNAGTLKDNLIPAVEPEDWDLVLDTNFFGAVTLFELYKEKLADSATIINMGSISGVKPRAGQGAYAVSKAMIIEWTRQLALQYDKGWRFYAISPGPVATDMIKQAPWYTKPGAFDRIPLRRFAEPEEIAELVLTLSDKNSPFQSGENFIIDGGFTLTAKE